MGKRGFSYIRFSTPIQQWGDSERRQEQMAEAYAIRMGITLDYSLNLKDAGLSGFSGAHAKKGALGKFLAAIEEGIVKRGDILLLEAIDRLSRQHVLDAMDMISAIIRAGIDIHTIEDGAIYDWNSLDNGEARRLGDKLEQARQFSKRLSRRMNDAWSEKKTNQSTITKKCPAWMKLENNEYKLIPERELIVRRIFIDTANGMGRYIITKNLNEEGLSTFDAVGQGIKVRNPKKKLWQMSYITKLLNNRALLGYYQPHKLQSDKTRIAVGEERLIYPPVIDLELWERAQAAKAARLHKGGAKGVNFRNILSGFCKCADCGASMIYKNKGKRTPEAREISYLVCDSAVRGGKCHNNTHFPYQAMEQKLLETMLFWHAYNPALFESSDISEHEMITTLSKSSQEREKKQTRIDMLMDSMDGVEIKSFKTKIIELEKEINDLDVKISKLKKDLEIARGASHSSHFERIARVYEKSDYQSRAILHQALSGSVERVLFYNEHQSAFVILKGFVMTFTITRDGQVKGVGIHLGDKTVLVVDGETKEIETPEGFLQIQNAKSDEAIAMIKRLETAFN